MHARLPTVRQRILIDNGWFSTLRRPNVELVTDAIRRIEPTGIRTADGTLHEVDVIVYATGFDVTNLAARIDFRGVGGVRLADDWADENPRALLGMTVPRLPNLFVMYGSNTNIGHGGSGMWLAETQSGYIVDRLCDMVECDVAAIDCRPERRDEYRTHRRAACRTGVDPPPAPGPIAGTATGKCDRRCRCASSTTGP